MKLASGLPVEVQFEPPGDLDVIDKVAAMGIDSVGIHIETFDPAVLARVAPAKARTGIDGYFAAWERAVGAFGEGQVSTYVILGMGEDPELTVEGCQRAMDMGVYPFVVPCARWRAASWGLPAARSGVHRADLLPGPRVHVAAAHGHGAAKAGCARCQACSGLGSMEALQIGRRPGA